MALRDWLLPAASPEAFARRVAAALRRAGVSERVRVMLHGVHYAGPADGQNVINLQNIYLDYRNAPRSQRGQVVDRLVALARANASSAAVAPEEARARLLPIVRDTLFFAMVDPLAAAGPPGVVRPLNDELSCGLCIDHDHAIQTVNADELARLGLTEDEAFALARRNLEARTNAPLASPAPGVYHTNFGDFHDSGRLAMPELFARLDVRGDVVVAVPNRTVVLATGTGDDDGVRRVCEVALDLLVNEPRSMTGTLFRLENFAWVPWLPARSSPAYPLARQLWLTGRAQQYAGQHDALEAALAKAGIDRFVASFSTIKRDGAGEGDRISYCVWADGVTNGSLPVTDLVVVGDDAAGANPALWADVMREAGHRLSRDPCGGPPRFLFTTSPSAEEIAAMPAMDLDAAAAVLARE